MRLKEVAIGILIGLIIGASAGFLILYPEIMSLREREKHFQDEIASLQQSELVKALSDKESQIARLEDTIAQYQSQVQVLESRIEAIQYSNVSLIAVSFSRTHSTSQILRHWIGRANLSITVAIFAFTQDSLGEALIEAKNRGVEVQIIIDNKNVDIPGSEFTKLKEAGIPIKSDTRKADMHHKFIIIDGYIVGTGSYNWSRTAEEENDENIILLKSRNLADMYLTEFNRLWS